MTPADAARLLIARHAREIRDALDAEDGERMTALMEVPVKLWLEGIAAEDGPLEVRILAALAQANALTVPEICQAVTGHRELVQETPALCSKRTKRKTSSVTKALCFLLALSVPVKGVKASGGEPVGSGPWKEVFFIASERFGGPSPLSIKSVQEQCNNHSRPILYTRSIEFNSCFAVEPTRKNGFFCFRAGEHHFRQGDSTAISALIHKRVDFFCIKSSPKKHLHIINDVNRRAFPPVHDAYFCSEVWENKPIASVAVPEVQRFDSKIKPWSAFCTHYCVGFRSRISGENSGFAPSLSFLNGPFGGFERGAKEPHRPPAETESPKASDRHCPLCPAVPKDDFGKIGLLGTAILGSVAIMFGSGWASWGIRRIPGRLRIYGGLFGGLFFAGLWLCYWLANVFLSIS